MMSWGSAMVADGADVMRTIRLGILLTMIALITGCGYNAIQQKDEAVTAASSEILNQYQRRADLVPNLVAAVKGYTQHEEDVLEKVTEARASVGKVTLTPDDLSDEQKVKQFQAAQGELSSALSRLMVVTENYPNLKADTLFQNLQTQLEGTENRITVARNRYIAAVQDYNTYIRSFPQNMTAGMFHYKTKANFTVENEKAISTAPVVDFSKPAPQPPAPPSPPQPAH
jgi:LemA protein